MSSNDTTTGRDHRTRRTLRVIVADDDPLSRRAVRDALQSAGITVIAEAGDARAAVELTLHYVPDLLLIEADLPGTTNGSNGSNGSPGADGGGLDAIRHLHEHAHAVRVIVHARTDDPEQALRSLRAGAAGYLPKSYGLEPLPRALRAAADGEAIVPRHVGALLIECVRRQREDGSGLRPVRSPLTGREWEVLDLLCCGLTTDEVAERLVLTTETVRSHIKHVMRKLGVSSRRQAVQVAQRMREAAMS